MPHMYEVALRLVGVERVAYPQHPKSDLLGIQLAFDLVIDVDRGTPMTVTTMSQLHHLAGHVGDQTHQCRNERLFECPENREITQ